MLRTVTKSPVFFMLFGVVMFIVGTFVFSPLITRGQENTTNTFQEHLQQLYNTDTTFYMGFVSPVDGDPGWALPEEFTNDAGEIIATRVITEIGEDFVCIDNAGEGLIVATCVPFTNIAFIRRPAP